LIFIFYQNNSN